MEDFPSNRRKDREPPREPRAEKVASGRRRRRPLGKQFRNVFFSGDARSAIEYTVLEVAIPEAKNLMVDFFVAGLERWILGERRPRGRGSSPYGQITNYNQYSRGPMRDDRPPMSAATRMMSRQARARHDFGEIVLESRRDADEVIDRMYDILSKYGEVSVADLLELVGIESTYVDKNWGWTDLRGTHIGRPRGGGYSLELPTPESLK